MFSLAEKRDYIVKNPFENKVCPASQVTEWWTDDYVYHQLIPAIREHAKPCNRFKTELKVRFAYTTGIRTGITHRIRRKDVSINSDGSIYVNTKCNVQKSAKMQRITTEILDETTKTMMKEYIEKLDSEGIGADDKIFARSQARTAYYNYRNTLRLICKKAGIRYLSPHKAKHGFITRMARAGLSSRKICALTGNKTPSLIGQVYSHVEFEDVKETAREIINNTS